MMTPIYAIPGVPKTCSYVYTYQTYSESKNLNVRLLIEMIGGPTKLG